MAMVQYNADGDTFSDLDGCGGTVGGPDGTPGTGPLEIPQNGDPFDYEMAFVGAGGTAGRHGLFGKLINNDLYNFRRLNRVEALNGVNQYTSGATGISIGNSFAILTAVAGTVAAIVNGNPSTIPVVVCTVSSTKGMRAGCKVVISGATGLTSINGTWSAYLLSDTTFAVPATANGTYNASSATAKWAMTLWQLATYLADNAAWSNATNDFGPAQSFAGNVTINGNLTLGGGLTLPVVAPTKYFSTPIVDQSPAYTGTSGGQTWTIGDPGTPVTSTTPAPSGQCNQVISPIIRFSQWGDASGGTQGLIIVMLQHVGSESPQCTIIFDPAVSTETLAIYDSGDLVNPIFEATAPGASSGSVTLAWKTGTAYRVISYSGFPGATISNVKW